MGQFGTEYNYPTKKNPSSKPLLGGQNVGPDGADGKNALFAVGFTNNILIPTDSDGSNPVYTDAIVQFEVWEGNVMLAEKAALDGWTSSLYSSSNVTVTDTTDLEATVTAISADHGSFVIAFAKAGYTTLYYKVHVHKAKKGVTGTTGDPGSTGGTGATGPAGPTGSDGTGLVVQKKSVIMRSYTGARVSTASNDGGLKFTTTGVHEMLLGETVNHLVFSESTYNGYHKISEIISTTEYRIESVAYVSAGAGTATPKSSLSPDALSLPQDLEWYDMVPYGSALMEVRLLMITDDDENELYAYLGFARNPTAGWNIYINGDLFEESGDQRSYPALGGDYLIWTVRGSPSRPGRRDLHLRLTPYAGNNWNTNYANVKFNLFSSYISLGPDTYGS